MHFFHLRTPIHFQVNPVECGAVALGIILDYYGYEFDQVSLNEKIGIAMSGSDAYTLIKAAEDFGLEAKAKKISVSELKKTKKPSIAFFDNAHFVVVEGYAFKRFFINDPARGRYRLSEREVRLRFSGIEIELEADRKKVARINSFSLSWSFLGALFGLTIGSLVIMLGALWSYLHDERFYEAFYSSAALGLVVVIGSFFLAHSIAELYAQYEQYSHTLILNALKKISPAFFETRPFYHYESLFKNSEDYFPLLYKQSFLCAVLVVFVLLQGWIFWPSMFILIILSVGIYILFSGQKTLIKNSLVSRYFVNNFQALNVMGQSTEVIDQELMKDHENLSLKKEHFSTHRLSTLVVALILLLTLVCDILMMRPPLSSGELSFADSIASLIFSLISVYVVFLIAWMNEPDYFKDSLLKELNHNYKSHLIVEELHNEIFIIEDAYFSSSYKSSFFTKRLALKKARLYGLVSKNASDKTVFLRVVGQKDILQDATFRIAKFGEHAARIALIDDKSELFAENLLENVRVFDTRYSDHDVYAALVMANSEEIFFRRPLGLLSKIEHEGANLSGGQRKRILLARALLRKPELLLLDNFFDSIDEISANTILRNLKSADISVIFSSAKDEQLSLSDEVIFIDEEIKISSHEQWKNQSDYVKLIIPSQKVLV